MAYTVTLYVSRRGVWKHLADLPTQHPEAWEVLDAILSEGIDFKALGALPGQAVLIELHPGHVQGNPRDRDIGGQRVLAVRQVEVDGT